MTHVIVRILAVIFVVGMFISNGYSQTQPPAWVATSNNYTKMLLEVEMKHSPESGSGEGLSEFDTKISQPTLADEDQQRHENEQILAKLKAAAAEKQEKEVAQDLQILIRRMELNFREEDYHRAHTVPFLNASGAV